ncbi:hypothetical protein [Devosia sp.]|uniref:hypothetical protein n=1 Tax=Devosia sp. TaxID=1871048 RepID=UPI003A929E8E
MRIPIILALLVVLLLPKDVQGLADDVGGYMQTATATVTGLFVRDEPTRVAELQP